MRSGFIFERAPFPAAHASTVAETPQDGGLVAAWFGGAYEGHEGVGIWLARGGRRRALVGTGRGRNRR